jgi:histidinol-phosphate aminotransferase
MDDSLRALLRPELSTLSSYVPASPQGIVARLDANEAPPTEAPEVRDAVARAVARTPLERYPDARAAELREAITLRTGARAEDLLIGTGSDEVIALIVNAFARPRPNMPQAVVLAPTPTFVMYRETSRGHGLAAREIPLDAQWDLDVTAMRRGIEMFEPSVLFLATPNNPTANRMSTDRIEAVIEAAKGAFVIVDEAYIDYARGPSLRSLRARYANVGILRTLSKIGLAALRVGWLDADAELVREIDKVRQPYNVSAVSQAAAAAVLREAWGPVEAQVARVVAERGRVAAALAAMSGVDVAPSDANFLWVKTERPAADVYGALVARGVLVRSFHASGGRLAKQLRITIGAPHDNDRLVAAMRECAG